MVRAKKWILVKKFEGFPKQENLELVEYDVSEDLKPNGKNQNLKSHSTQNDFELKFLKINIKLNYIRGSFARGLLDRFVQKNYESGFYELFF